MPTAHCQARLLSKSGVAIFFLAMVLGGCSMGPGYEQYADGLAVRVSSGAGPDHVVRIRVIGDHIIRVSQLPVDSLRAEPAAVAHTRPVWRVERAGGSFIVHTASLQARVSMETGGVLFADAQGNVILQERDSSGVRFKPVQFGSRYVNAVKQVFYAADDEAIYGALEPWLQNAGGGSPFMVSTRNYGILWNNNPQKHTVPRDYYFIHGDNLDAVVAGYRTLTGRVPLPDYAMLAPQYEVPGAATTWSWPELKAQVLKGLNQSLAGEAYWSAALAGFTCRQGQAERTECAVRAFQFAALCPRLRTARNYPYRGNDGGPALPGVLYYEGLRYRLLPYLYALAGRAHFADYTPMRALVMDFAHDQAVINISDEYMLGPALLAAPVTEYLARNWKIYLPAGAGWYDFYTGKFYQGGQTVQAHAPLERIPLFVRAGSVLPLDAPGRLNGEPVTLYVFTGADGSFEYYEAAGEAHPPLVIPMHYDEATGSLTLGARKGAGPGVPHTFHILWVKRDRFDGPGGSNTPPHQTITYHGAALIVRNDTPPTP